MPDQVLHDIGYEYAFYNYDTISMAETQWFCFWATTRVGLIPIPRTLYRHLENKQ